MTDPADHPDADDIDAAMTAAELRHWRTEHARHRRLVAVHRASRDGHPHGPDAVDLDTVTGTEAGAALVLNVQLRGAVGPQIAHQTAREHGWPTAAALLAWIDAPVL